MAILRAAMGERLEIPDERWTAIYSFVAENASWYLEGTLAERECLSISAKVNHEFLLGNVYSHKEWRDRQLAENPTVPCAMCMGRGQRRYRTIAGLYENRTCTFCNGLGRRQNPQFSFIFDPEDLRKVVDFLQSSRGVTISNNTRPISTSESEEEEPEEEEEPDDYDYDEV